LKQNCWLVDSGGGTDEVALGAQPISLSSVKFPGALIGFAPRQQLVVVPPALVPQYSGPMLPAGHWQKHWVPVGGGTATDVVGAGHTVVTGV